LHLYNTQKTNYLNLNSLSEIHCEIIELFFFFFAPARLCGKFNRKNPKEAQRAAKFFGVSGGKIEVFFFLFAPSLPPRLRVK
jgi:hypothetical protein